MTYLQVLQPPFDLGAHFRCRSAEDSRELLFSAMVAVERRKLQCLQPRTSFSRRLTRPIFELAVSTNHLHLPETSKWLDIGEAISLVIRPSLFLRGSNA